MDQEARQCLVRWHEYSNSVTVAVQTLRYDEELLDVTLACEGQTIRAHKLVLAASSQYFRKIFKEFPCEHPTIVVDNMKFDDLLSILHFMYYGQVLVEEEVMTSLLDSAASLAVIGLSYVSEALGDYKVKYKTTSNMDSPEEGTIPNDDKKEHSNDDECEFSSMQSKEKDKTPKEDNRNSISPPPSTLSETDKITSNCQQNETQLKDIKRLKPPRDSTELPNKRQKLICDNNSSLASNLRRETSLRSISPFENGIKNIPGTDTCIQSKTTGSIDITLIKSREVLLPSALEEEEEESSSNKKLDEDERVELSDVFNHVINGEGNHLYETDTMEDEMDEEEPSCPEIADLDLGPAPLPMNHPAVIAAAASTSAAVASAAAAMAATMSSGGGSNSFGSSLNAVNYAALLAANAKGLLPNSNFRSYLMSQGGGNSLLSPWMPLEQSPSTSPPLGSTSPHPPGYIYPTAMSQQDLQATLDQYQRKLAFHEPRPCPTCKRMYRDAATLRTHISIMHSEGKEPFTCTCAARFRTKYDMYQHRKQGHR